MRYLDEADVRAVLRWDPLIAAMESALVAFSSGRVIQPVRNMLTIEEGEALPGNHAGGLRGVDGAQAR